MSYSKFIMVNATSDQVFSVLTAKIHLWWSRVEKIYNETGDEFPVFFGDTEWRFEIKRFEVPFFILWLCIKAHHIDQLDGIEDEWLNTEFQWRISQKKKLTKIAHDHIGLTEELNCYEFYEAGWDFSLE